MGHVINIHGSGQEIHLKARTYKIDVLGGWGVQLGQFSIALKNVYSEQVVNCERSFWPVRSFAFDKRAKRIFSVDIPDDGDYVVEFRNAETLKVNESGLFFVATLFQEPIPNRGISVYIH